MKNKTFRKRIKLSKLRIQGLRNSDIMLRLYLDRAWDNMIKNVLETFDRITGGRYKDNESV